MTTNHLRWSPELGIGYFPVTAQPYDKSYWERYRLMDQTAIGEELTALRRRLVEWHFPDRLIVDVGIGGGRFVQEYPLAQGYDVNPCAVNWLKDNKRWQNPYHADVDGITCWDSLEHIADPTPLLDRVRECVFVSIPIFDDLAHVLRSKHFRKDEHFWYFTHDGFVRFMAGFGFDLVISTTMEQSVGREDIGTYVFKRVAVTARRA